MIRNRSLFTGRIRRIVALQSTLLLTMIMSYGQETMQNPNTNNFENEWWYPIIQKHKIDISQFNHRTNFICINTSNVAINNWLILGNSDTINDRNIKLKNALIIVMFPAKVESSDQNYWILSSPTIHHDFDKNTIAYSLGNHVWFDIKNKEIVPLKSTEMLGTFNLNAGIKIAPDSYRKFLP
jgi:hypothetical protein